MPSHSLFMIQILLHDAELLTYLGLISMATLVVNCYHKVIAYSKKNKLILLMFFQGFVTGSA